MALKTLCAKCGTPSDQGLCPRHRPNESQRSARRGPSGYARQRLVAKILERDMYMCQGCGHRAVAVDHIIPLWKGGSNEPFNLTSLCKHCHDRKTAAEARERSGR